MKNLTLLIVALLLSIPSFAQSGSINFTIGRSQYLNSHGTITIPPNMGGLRYYAQGGYNKWQYTNDQGSNWIDFGSGTISGLTTNYVTKATSSTTIGNSSIFDNGTDIGVGTTSINSFATGTLDIEVKSASTSNGGVLWLNNADDTQEAYYAMTTSGLIAGTNTNHPFIFRINNTEVGRITTGGNIGYGTTSPTTYATNARHLELKGTTTSRGGILSLASSDASQVGNIMMSDAAMTVGSFTNHSLLFNTNNTERFRINTSGALGIAGANFGSSGQVLSSAGSAASPTWLTPPWIDGTLTATRIPYASDANTLTDEAALSYDATTNTIQVANTTTDLAQLTGNFINFEDVTNGDEVTLSSTGLAANDASGTTNFTVSNATGTMTISTLANNANITLDPHGTGKTIVDNFQITSGSPGSGKVLTSDASGNTSWTSGYSASGSGSYTPTLTSAVNVSSSTAHNCEYMYVGARVTVGCKVTVDPNLTSSITSLRISLPIASGGFATDDLLSGTATSIQNSAHNSGTVVANTVNGDAFLSFYSDGSGNTEIFRLTFVYSYSIP